MMKEALFSHSTCEWETPKALFDKLNEEFHFTLDPCSTHENAKCDRHYTKEENGLVQDWYGETVFCNPPYGKDMPDWIRKCHDHAESGGGRCRNAHSCEDRYKGFSRNDLWASRNSIYKGTVKIWKF